MKLMNKAGSNSFIIWRPYCSVWSTVEITTDQYQGKKHRVMDLPTRILSNKLDIRNITELQYFIEFVRPLRILEIGKNTLWVLESYTRIPTDLRILQPLANSQTNNLAPNHDNSKWSVSSSDSRLSNLNLMKDQRLCIYPRTRSMTWSIKLTWSLH